MKLDELEWIEHPHGFWRRADLVGTKYYIFQATQDNASGKGCAEGNYDICTYNAGSNMWPAVYYDLDPITAQALLYELLKNKSLNDTHPQPLNVTSVVTAPKPE